MDDDDNSDDAYPNELTGKYDGEGKKKGKGRHRRYRDDKETEALHCLYELKDDDGERGYHDDDWEDMEEKEWENEDDDVIDITAAQFFRTPNQAFLIKKNKKTEEKKGDDGDENGDGDAKRGEKKRKGIDGSVLKEKEGNDFNNTKCKYMYILSFFRNN